MLPHWHLQAREKDDTVILNRFTHLLNRDSSMNGNDDDDDDDDDHDDDDDDDDDDGGAPKRGRWNAD